MRRFLLSSVVVIAAIFVSAYPSTASEGVPQIRRDNIVKSGQRDRIGRARQTEPDCTVSRVPNVRVIEPPSHGRVALVREQEVITGAKGRFAKCNSRQVPVIAYYYQSTPGYIGRDRFVVRISFRDGFVTDRISTIQVKK